MPEQHKDLVRVDLKIYTVNCLKPVFILFPKVCDFQNFTF